MGSKRHDMSDLISRLFDLLADSPDGITKHEMSRKLGIPLYTVNRLIIKFRHVMREDTINLVCDPQGQREPWLYRLVGDYESMAPWTANRVKDLEARTFSTQSVWKSLVNGTDGRTIEGRKAREYEMHFRHLKERIAAIEAEV